MTVEASEIVGDAGASKDSLLDSLPNTKSELCALPSACLASFEDDLETFQPSARLAILEDHLGGLPSGRSGTTS